METMTELAWLSGALPTARVGISAAVLPMRDVPWLAKQANTLHRIAGGGLVLVTAPGFWRQDIEARGVSYERRGTHFDQALDALLDVLTDDGFSPGRARTARRRSGWPVPPQRCTRQPTVAGCSSRRAPCPTIWRPGRADYYDRGGTFLAHRVRLEIGDHAVVGEALDWHAVTGSVDQVVDTLGRYVELGVRDLSLIPGADDNTSRTTLAALIDEVVPQL